MRKHTLKITFLLLLAIVATSCVDRKTQNDEGTIRLEAPENNTADTDYTEAVTDKNEAGDNKEMSNEDMVEMANAKSVINDYYDAFTRKAPREAYDMWDQASNNSSFSKFSEEHPSYEKITVTFDEDKQEAQLQQQDSVYTATVPVRMSATNGDGNIINYSGMARLKKDAKEDNAKYKIESMDLKKEDS